MKAVIIIPACDRPQDLARCLESVQREVAGHAEVGIVVSDDSKDDSIARVLQSFPEVRRLIGPRKGPGANRNCAASQVEAEWLVFLDDDCEAKAGWFDAYWSAFETAKGVLEGRTEVAGGLPSLLWESPENVTGGTLPSCNFAIQASVFREMNGFDERFRLAFEDMEFRARLVRLGVAIRFLPEAAVVHDARRIQDASLLVRRWEPRVTYMMDLGATNREVLQLLPRHIGGVLLAVWQQDTMKVERWAVARLYLQVFCGVLVRLPGWIAQHRKQPRSAFWEYPPGEGPMPPRFGL